MPGQRSSRRYLAVLLAQSMVISMLGTAATVGPAAALGDPRIPVIAPGSAYRQANLVSDVPGIALVQDPLLINPWGMTFRGASPLWVANNGTGTSGIYSGDVAGSPFVPNPGLPFVTIPGGLPTGTVSNATTDFALPGACAAASCPAAFLFASITGNITGWNPSAPAAGSTTAVIAASNPGRVYTGLANGSNSGGNRLYAADFANGTVDAYDPSFALTTTTGSFADPTIPTAAGNTFHPFNIQAIGASLYVTYAKVGTDGLPEPGVGIGYVRRFNTDGLRDLTFGINNGPLNAPWGIAIAPSSFGIFGSALLVGNFGEGNPSIHAFNPTTGAFLGTIQDESGNGIVIDKLWALTFGNGASGGSVDTLYFTAGLGDEQHGLVGSLNPTTASATSIVHFSADEYTLGEGTGKVVVTVARDGDASGAASVRYATWDYSAPDHAHQKADYQMAAGMVSFAPGQTSRTFKVHVVDDPFDENDETIGLMLSNPVGTALGFETTSTVIITDNDTGAPTTNAIDDSAFFVRQHYLDFLGRRGELELADWVSFIEACGGNTACRANRRARVSASIFQSPETQALLSLIYRLRRAAFGSDPLYGEVMLGAEIRRTVGLPAMLDVLVTSPQFVARYPATLSNSQYVDQLIAASGYPFSTARRNAWVAGLNSASLTRTDVLVKLARDVNFRQFVRDRYHVHAAFWGYLRRDADSAAFNARLAQLQAGGGDPRASGMVNTFLTSNEYRERFGPA